MLFLPSRGGNAPSLRLKLSLRFVLLVAPITEVFGIYSPFGGGQGGGTKLFPFLRIIQLVSLMLEVFGKTPPLEGGRGEEQSYFHSFESYN
jgi:hypothetical protein